MQRIVARELLHVMAFRKDEWLVRNTIGEVAS